MSTTPTPIPPGRPDTGTAIGWLDREERRVRRAVSQLRAAGLDVPADDDVGEQVSAHQPGDVASETLEREVDLGLIDDFRRTLDEITGARQRLAAGRYGVCERCRAYVDPLRLEAVPATRFCRPCADQVEHLSGLRVGTFR